MGGRFQRRSFSVAPFVALALISSSSALAQAPGTPTSASPGTVDPAWITPPRPDSPPLTPDYRGGLVDLSCISQPEGEVTDCTVTYETPNPAGLGALALAAMAPARMSPRTVDGVAEASPVRFAVQFDAYGSQPPIVRRPVPPPPPGVSLLISMPVWARQPMPEYPERAMAQGIQQGLAVLSCGFISSGDLVDCEVVEESPPDAGFGRSALAGARRGRVSERTVRESPAGSRVTMPIRYVMP